MKTLEIQETKGSPYINLNPENGICEIRGRSLPENAINFYQPVKNWFENLIHNPPKHVQVDFRFEYFNTASAKQLVNIFIALQDLSKITKLKINWYHSKYDSDVLTTGERFRDIFKLNFKFCEMDE